MNLQHRLSEANCEVTPVVDHRVLRSIYFHDPHGIALEASWWTVDSDGLSFRPEDPILFADPDPVPAVAELADGDLRSTPATRLL
ncbi:MAG TPA: hypothetical protein DCR10_03090 [Acidimicrobiaceae bacterium]|nr:hypothetical protein [Acidimicrobiaceae bacterium]